MATDTVTEDAVDAALNQDFRLLVGSELRTAADGRTEPVVDPSTGRKIADVQWAGPADVDAACKAAQKAFGLSGLVGTNCSRARQAPQGVRAPDWRARGRVGDARHR